MKLKKFSPPALAAILLAGGAMLTALPSLVRADSNPGLTIFSGVERKDILDYFLQYGGRPNQWDRYKLYVPSKKVPQGASTFFISYPDYFKGEFDTKRVEVRTKKENLPIKEVVWDKQSRFLEITLEKPLPPNTRAEIVLSNVKNPDLGTYYLVCDVLASGDIPVRLYVGTWILSIEQQWPPPRPKGRGFRARIFGKGGISGKKSVILKKKHDKEAALALYAELHRHLGGSVVPRVLWRYFQRHDFALAQRFPEYLEFEDFYTRERSSLDEYLELHTLVESVQTLKTLPYFIYRLIRGAYIFENLAYLELRYTPYYRTSPALEQSDRIALMPSIVNIVAESAKVVEYPIVTSQILCMHSRLPYEVNKAIVDLAADNPNKVCGIDIAGGDSHYGERMEEFVRLYQYAQSLGLKTTGHLYETVNGCYPQLLPYLRRIGHGIQIPLQYPELLPELAQRGQCLEICPTTYLKTGTLEDLSQLKVVFDRCFAAGVDIAICTDNAGLHNVRLPFEYENLLTQDVIDFQQLQMCQDAAFRHAFAWPYPEGPASLLTGLLKQPKPEKQLLSI